MHITRVPQKQAYVYFFPIEQNLQTEEASLNISCLEIRRALNQVGKLKQLP